MATRRLARLELQVMEVLWSRGASSIREVHESFPGENRPAYTTIQTTIYRLEEKTAVRRVRKIGNAHIFEAVVSRASAHRRLIDDLVSLFGGRSQPILANLIETGRLTLADIREAEAKLRSLSTRERK